MNSLTNVHDLFLLIFCVSCLAFYSFQVHAQRPFLTHCFEPSNYTSGSQYQSNLNHLFSSLHNQLLNSSSHFATAASGDDPNRVYGLIQCRGDISMEECGNCVNTSTTIIVNECPFRKEAAVRYDHCVLHYSDSPFFSRVEVSMIVILRNFVNVSGDYRVRFNEQLGSLMSNLSETAASSSSRFATGKRKFSDFQTLYGLSQCTNDLSPLECNSCLRTMINQIPSCCEGLEFAHIASVSCNLMYDTKPFFNSPTSPPSSPDQTTPPPLPPLNPHDDHHNSATNNTAGKANNSKTVAAVVVPVATAGLLTSAMCTLLLWRKANKKEDVGIEDSEVKTQENLLLMNLSALKVATGNFSDTNKLGQGGFGPVYKGKLLDGREVAVKRLASNSTQGLEELRAEVLIIAKLEHKNLVRLLGCCLEEKEKLLVYEYLPNGSLDRFLFGNAKRENLYWQRRFKIIEGIARGLLYLHQESQFQIIHRDLKASNVLLDEDLNPKISDFGLARKFEGSHYVGKTKNVAGTYGYMPPEYAIRGRFSTKSDVFSFGVMVLEIVTGRNATSFPDSNSANLQTYAWQHWTRNQYFELVDQSLRGRYSRSEVLRCIHIGLLCVQKDSTKRPTMSAVVVMLSSSSVSLATPSKPAFLSTSSSTNNSSNGLPTHGDASELDNSSSMLITSSKNDLTISELDPR